MPGRFEMSIEVLDGAFPASSWQFSYGDTLTSTALEHGASEWRWVQRPWGLVLEIAFTSRRRYERWRELPVVVSSFDAVPDPVNGLVFHRGWGGTSGSGEPRRPRPRVGSGAAAVEIDDVGDEPIVAIADGVRLDGLTDIRTAAAR